MLEATTVQTGAVRLRKRALFTKFFADRGTHLAAMVAYFALLSFVPLVFLALSLLGFAHRADASDFLVRELSRAFPGSSLESILTLVHRVQDNAATLGIIGGVALIWSSLSLFSALESAFNIVYGRPNRRFLHGKGLAASVMVGGVVTLFASLVVGAIGVEAIKQYAPSWVSGGVVAYVLSIAVSLLGVFLFLFAVYRLLPNVHMTSHDALPGASRRRGRARGVVPDPAGVRAPRGRERDPARPRRPRDPAPVALRHGERHRLRRGVELVGGATTPSCERGSFNATSRQKHQRPKLTRSVSFGRTKRAALPQARSPAQTHEPLTTHKRTRASPASVPREAGTFSP